MALLVMAAVLRVVWMTATPGLTAVQVCRTSAARSGGYGPWRQLGVRPSEERPGVTEVIFNDSMNTMVCYTSQVGGIWIVRSTGTTFVMCGQGLGRECKFGYYGVE